MKKIVLDCEQLKELYIDRELSITKIASLLNVTYASVWTKLAKYGIPRRSRPEAIRAYCRVHRGRNNPKWKGRSPKGNYMSIHLLPDDEYYEMAAKDNRVYEHRLVMAKHLGRPLLKNEYVHHIDGDKTNNDIRNLKLVSLRDHAIYDELCSKCPLRKEIKLLQWQINELTKQLQGRLVE